MTDYYLRNADQAEFDQLMLDIGLGVMGEEGVQPISAQVCIDRIGPIVRFDTSMEPPTEIVRPEYHTNLRLTPELTEEQVSALAPYVVVPSGNPHRVWADDPSALTQEAAILRDEEYANSLAASIPVTDSAFEEGGLV